MRGMSSSESFQVIPPLSRTEAIAPHAFAAEQALLGALLSNGELWEHVDGKLSADYFYDKRNEIIFSVVQKLFAERHADWRLLVLELKNTGQLREVGGEEYLADLGCIAASAVNVPGYVEQIRNTAQLRRTLALIQETNARALHPGDASPQKILDETEARLSEIGRQFDGGQGGMQSAAQKAREFFDNLTDVVNKKEFDRLLGLRSGYAKLDSMTTGLHGGDLMIVAGRPGAGKTAFALNIVRHVSADNSPVAIFSLEMSAKQLVMRLVSQDGLSMQKLRTGKDYQGRPMSGEDLRKFSDSVSSLEKRRIFIDESGALNVLEIRARSRRLARTLRRDNADLKMIVVDYLQLLSAASSDSNENRAMEVAKISRGLKTIAKELDVPVIACAQLNRGVEMRVNKEPLLSDLRESGSIEQDADIVLFLHEEKSDAAYDPSADSVQSKLIVGKHRNGPVGRINLTFNKRYSRFVETAEDGGDF